MAEPFVLDDGCVTDTLVFAEDAVGKQVAFPTDLKRSIAEVIDLDILAGQLVSHLTAFQDDLSPIVGQTELSAHVALLAKLTAGGFTPCAVVETSAGNFQAWLKHPSVLPKLLSTFAAQTLASRYDADPSAADWRRFGRLPGFTNCKPKYKRPDGLFPFVQLKSHTGKQYFMAEVFVSEITKLS